MFKEVKVSKLSIAKRKSIYGVGINDAQYKTLFRENGKNHRCPYYRRWFNMLTRCYSEDYHNAQPTYAECIVCDDWLKFSNFKEWMSKQDWRGKELDKDLLKQGNKKYSPENCIFVSKKINSLLTDRGRHRGQYPKGVYFSVRSNKFHARCSVAGKKAHIGYFDTEKEAHDAYLSFKRGVLVAMANKESEPLKGALLSYDLTL